MVPRYLWKPIEALTNGERHIDLAEISHLYDIWRASKARMQQDSRAQLAVFQERIVRRLSVETGILERLYELDRGTTEALVANGFAEELITRLSTDIEPSRLIDLLTDQEAAIQLVIDGVARNRDLTKGFIHELHAVLTNHQDSTTAVDQFGNRMEIPLVKGKYKEQPNNPRRPEGTIHEYCPPIHVESEMDQLIGWLDGYHGEDPVIVAAWVHHRFTQIHPYQDGNGRVSRALTTLILLRAGLLPVVIDRDLRVQYISSLELADLGDLSPLVNLFARLERNAILQGLTIDADARMVPQQSGTAMVIQSIQDKISRRQTQDTSLREVNGVAIRLRSQAEPLLRKSFQELAASLGGSAVEVGQIQLGGSDRENGYRYLTETSNSAKQGGKFVNPAENYYFLKASVRAGREELVFIVSFHHVGRELTGIMEAAAFFRLRTFDQLAGDEHESALIPISSADPFVFTHHTEAAKITGAFHKWLDTSLAVALKEFGDRL